MFSNENKYSSSIQSQIRNHETKSNETYNRKGENDFSYIYVSDQLKEVQSNQINDNTLKENKVDSILHKFVGVSKLKLKSDKEKYKEKCIKINNIIASMKDKL